VRPDRRCRCTGRRQTDRQTDVTHCLYASAECVRAAVIYCHAYTHRTDILSRALHATIQRGTTSALPSGVTRRHQPHAVHGRFARTAIVSPGSLGSRVVSVLDSGAVRPGFKSRSRRCRVTVLGKLFTPIVPLFTKQRN